MIECLLMLVISTSYYLYTIILFFSILTLALTIFILVYISLKKQLIKKGLRRRHIAELFIHKAIFYEDDEQRLNGTIFFRENKLIKHALFRNILTEEILTAKQNISGESSERLRIMYLQLKLDQYALKKLKDRRWYIKARGIQELVIMDMKEHTSQVSPFTADPHELVRIEAQTAMVKLDGYKGLHFLDTVTYPITDWQQIKLLKELPHLPSDDNFASIVNWLKTANDSVVIFAMRIVRTYHLFQLHDVIIGCLGNNSSSVRLEAIKTLKGIYMEETSARLKAIFPSETLKNQIAIAKALQSMGSDEDITFLLFHLNCIDFDLKLALLRAISSLSSRPLAELINLPDRETFPLREMIRQISMEVVV